MKKQLKDNNVLTKQYFDKKLDKYVTKNYFDKKLDKYVTKDYFDKKFNTKFSEQNKNIDKKFDAISESIKFELEPIHEFKKKFESFQSQVLNTLDWLVKAFKKFDEEHTILTGKYSKINEKIDNHDQRIVVLEKKVTYKAN